MADVVPQVPATLPTQFTQDQVFLRLAREIAMDILPIDTILANHNITPDDWARIQVHPRFIQLLISNQEAWGSSLNTAERVRVKSLAMVEEVLPEFYSRMHDARELLSGKVEVLKTIARFAGVSEKSGDVLGEKFSVTINLGGDEKVRIEKNVTPQVTPALLQSQINPDGTLDCL